MSSRAVEKKNVCQRKTLLETFKTAPLRSPVQLFICSILIGSPMPFMFEKLEVYQKAIDFADRITHLTEQFPRGYYFLVDQLNRAAVSISTNIAEGNGRFTKADRRNFFTIARGSVQECVPLLELCLRRGFGNEKVNNQFRDELEVLAKMISGLIKGIENRDK